MKFNRRNFLASTATLAMGTSLGLQGKDQKNNSVLPVNAEAPSLEGKKVLYTYGGWHGHEPKQSVDIFKPWMESEGAEVEVFDNLDPYADEAYMDKIDLVVQIFTMSEISKEQEKGLLNAVKRGTGIAGWHGGLCDSFRQNVAYQFMTGGQWVAHPGGVIDYSVQITDKEDPVTKGLGEFKMHSEQYYMHVDPKVEVLATTTFGGEYAPWVDGAVMPV